MDNTKDERLELIKRIEFLMGNILDDNQLRTLDITLIRTLSEYNIEKQSTELTIYDDSNDKILICFTNYLRMNGKSQNTIKQYLFNIRKVLDDIGKVYNEVNEFDMHNYFANKMTKVSKVSYNNYIRYTNAFFKWLYEDRYVQYNPMSKIKIIKVDKVVKKPFTISQRDCLRDNASTPRDKALLSVLYSTGCRISEILRVNIEDVNNGEIIVRGKGNKERVVYLDDSAKYYLDLYLKSRKDNNNALFVANRNGKGLERARLST